MLTSVMAILGWLVIIAFVAGGLYWAWRNGLGGGGQ